MARYRTFNPITQAAGIIAALLVLISGVTFAALQSQQAKLTGNVIQTATANLQVSTDGSSYSNSQAGFAFANLVPGGQAVPAPGYPLYLKNAGGTPLALKLAVSSTPSNPDNVDFAKVHVILIPATGNAQPQNFTLQALISSATTGGVALTSPSVLMPGSVQQFSVQISMDSDAVSGASATINNVDLSFGGTAVN